MSVPIVLLLILDLLLLLVTAGMLRPIPWVLNLATGHPRASRAINFSLWLLLPILLFLFTKSLATAEGPSQSRYALSPAVSELAVSQAPTAGPGIGLTPLNASSTATNATITLTLPAVANQTNFCTGFEITYGGATAATSNAVTLTGIAGGTQNYLVAVPAVPASGVNAFTVEFTYPLQASATNTAIVLTVPAAGAGNTNTSACLHGYLK